MVRYLLKKIISRVAVITALGVTCFSVPAYAETLRMAWSQDAMGLDPHKQTAFSSIRLLELIYEPLVRLDKDLQIVPAIADSWQFSTDAMELTFNLNPNATFQDGSALTSADVKASFERILDEETGASARANYTSIETIDTPDDHTVVFYLSQSDVPILTAMTSLNSAILSVSEISAGAIGTTAMGSGPFSLENGIPIRKKF